MKTQVCLSAVRYAWCGWIAVLFLAYAPTALGQGNGWRPSPQPLNGLPPSNGLPSNNGLPPNNGAFNAPAGNVNYGNSSRMDPRIAGLPNTSNPNVTSGVAVSSARPDGSADPANTEGKIPVRNLLQIFHDGGLMMYPIALCSFALMVFSFERLIHLRRGRVIPRPFVNRLIEQLQQQQIDREEAIELCEKNPNPMSKIMTAALKRYGRPSVEVEQAVLDAGERESNQLRKYMRLLSAISNVAPLLGLLGTVMGMIQSFNDISNSQAMGRPEMLAGGISQALLTTAAGLLVAIPAYAMYVYFVGHIDRLIMEMDHHGQRLVDVVSAEGLQENDVGRSRGRSRKAA